MTHIPDAAEIDVANAGTYLISFSTTGTEPNQFTLFDNGVAIPGATYGSGAGTQQNDGQVIATVAAGDTLTLVNDASAAAVGLQTLAGGTATNVNASVVVEKLG